MRWTHTRKQNLQANSRSACQFCVCKKTVKEPQSFKFGRHFQYTCTAKVPQVAYRPSIKTPGGWDWAYFPSTGSGSRDTGRFSTLPYVGMKPGIWKKVPEFADLYAKCKSFIIASLLFFFFFSFFLFRTPLTRYLKTDCSKSDPTW